MVQGLKNVRTMTELLAMAGAATLQPEIIIPATVAATTTDAILTVMGEGTPTAQTIRDQSINIIVPGSILPIVVINIVNVISPIR